SAEEALPLELTVDFHNDSQAVQVAVGDVGSVALRIADGHVRSGLIFLGQRDPGVTVRRLNVNAPGLDILGTLPYFNYDDWMRALREPVPALASQDGVAAPVDQGSKAVGVMNFAQWRDVVNAVDLSIGHAVILGQDVPDLNLQIASEEREWRMTLNSGTVQGTVQVPYTDRDPLVVALDHLHLPAAPEEEDTALESGAEEQEKIDPLLDFDPRTLPRMRFTAAGILRGEVDYGSWQF